MLYLLLIGLITLFLFVWLFSRNRFDKGVVKGRRVLITGASTGIGAELAFQYAKHGASVFVTARSEDLLKEVVEKCKSLGIETAKHGYIVSDMLKYETEAQKVIDGAVKFLGGLDTVVLNHAALGKMMMWIGSEENLEIFDRLIKINFCSYVHLGSAALPHLMKSKQGRLAVTSSIASKIPWPGTQAYTCCKFALDGFFSCWAMELKQAKDKLTLTIINPGFVATKNVTTALQDGFSEILKAGDVVEKMPRTQYADAVPTAYEAMKATETGQREVYYPYLYRSAYLTIPAWTMPLFRVFVEPLMALAVLKPILYQMIKKGAGLHVE